jgi:hypothetical protein
MTPEQREIRAKLHNELTEAKAKMATACQNGSKKAWRKYGKKVYKLSLLLGYSMDGWLGETFKNKV